MITLRIYYSSTYRTLLQFSPKFWLEYDKIKATLSPKANTYLPRGFMFQYNLCIVWWCAIGALNCELFAFDIVLFMKGWPNGPCELSLNNTWAQEKQCSMEKKSFGSYRLLEIYHTPVYFVYHIFICNCTFTSFEVC